MNYAYLRVSTDKQDVEHQEYEIYKYANKNNLTDIIFHREIISGKPSKNRIIWQKREIGKLIERLEPDDLLLISEISRLSRSMYELFDIFKNVIVDKKASIVVVKSNLLLKDDISTKAVLFAHALVAEFEGEINSARTKEALRALKAKGIKLGRPKGSRASKLDVYEDKIREARSKGASHLYLSRVYGVSESAISYFCKTRNIKKL